MNRYNVISRFNLKKNLTKMINNLFTVQVATEGTCQGGQGRYNARGFDLNRNFPDYFKNVSPHQNLKFEKTVF